MDNVLVNISWGGPDQTTYPKELNDHADRLKSDLARISFKPSCLDFGWGWKIEFLFNAQGRATHFMLYSGFKRPDTHTGEISTGYGRGWPIPIEYTEKGLFMTCHMAIKQIIEHEYLEAFCVDDCRVFDPHNTMEDLMFPEGPKGKKFKDLEEIFAGLSPYDKL